jgi:hypothetical protein
MAVSFASYEIARSGLFVNERGLYVTGHIFQTLIQAAMSDSRP